jgi:GTP pyrophosphokinase
MGAGEISIEGRSDGSFIMQDKQMLDLQGIYLAPYMQVATALIGKMRHSGGNMFRHQIDTLAILIDYGYIDSVLLKAACIHDIIEDVPDFNVNQILNIDAESRQVYDLVQEVSRKPGQPKPAYLRGIIARGSTKAKILKCADRISNMISLGFVNNPAFIRRYSEETAKYIFPIADEVEPNMRKELGDLVSSRLALEERLVQEQFMPEFAESFH